MNAFSRLQTNRRLNWRSIEPLVLPINRQDVAFDKERVEARYVCIGVTTSVDDEIPAASLVCGSHLLLQSRICRQSSPRYDFDERTVIRRAKIGRASCRERV